ncbi:MAG: hypothetical protein JRF15_14810 [Deltaproteobacteria bacterium]|nr:hypothetical protein [Deltaproteobacteria bacterium]
MNLRSKWLLPISIRGSQNYDVTEIDVSSLRLAGEVEPLQWRFKKRARGHTDLKLKFSSEEMCNALGNLEPGRTYEVWITGRFKNGTRIMGSDSFIAVGRPARKQASEIRRSSEGGEP